MDEDEELVFELDDDSFSDAPDAEDVATGELLRRRCYSPQDKRAGKADTDELVTHGTFFEGLDVDGHIGKFRHVISDC